MSKKPSTVPAPPRRETRLSSAIAKRKPATFGPGDTLGLLKARLLDEMDPSRADWGGTPVEIDRYEDPVSPDHKLAVQAQGATFGCHSHDQFIRLELDTDQPWIGDHIPPTQLSLAARKALGVQDKVTVLFAQCDLCAELQSELVRRLNALSGTALTQAVSGLTAHQKKLLVGGLDASTCSVPSSGPKVSSGEGSQVQNLGDTHGGCHSCGRATPKSKYHADHCPPVLLHQPTAQQILAALGIDLPQKYYALPQCPKCSHEQGGSMARVKALLKLATVELKMPNYYD